MDMTTPKKNEQGRKPSHLRHGSTTSLAGTLSRLELLCMKALWHQRASTVREVQDALRPRRPLAYTTILTVLDRLHDKGAVRRVKQGKAYSYEPTISFVDCRHMALSDLLDFYFEGSQENLRQFLAASGTADSPTSHPMLEISDELL
jgi:predicted transcriptional regulator